MGVFGLFLDILWDRLVGIGRVRIGLLLMWLALLLSNVLILLLVLRMI